MAHFDCLDLAELDNIIAQLRSSTCCLDPLPTKFFKTVFNCLAPEVLDLINWSLQSGIFPTSLKIDVVKLLLKNTMDPNVITNYRPISNLPFLSKILEKTVYIQQRNYLTTNTILDIH